MEVFLSKLTQQAMNYAIRSGLSITATYAIRQSSRLLKNVHGEDRYELLSLQQRLESKIQVISPAIDMIELIAARGNTSLESAVTLTKSLRWDIQYLGQRLAKAAASEEIIRQGAVSSKKRARNDAEIKLIIRDIKRLLNKIEDAVPLMNLAITTSGAKLSTNLPSTVSPSRLLQASTFLTAGDTQYSLSTSAAVQIGPTFTLSVYMLFAGHVRTQDEESIRETTWKEVIHKARLKLRRVSMDLVMTPGDQLGFHQLPAEAKGDEFAYQLLIIEDLQDGRVHTFDEREAQPQSYEGVEIAGIREIIPIHQISKIFYADTGKILNISTEGEANNPVLLLKRDLNAIPPRRMVERNETVYSGAEEHQEEEEVDEIQAQLDAQLTATSLSQDGVLFSLHESSIPEEWRLPPGLDQEWIAFEVYNDNDDNESDAESDIDHPKPPSADVPHNDTQRTSSSPKNKDKDKDTEESLSASPSTYQLSQPNNPAQSLTTTVSNPLFNNIRTSLSLLEMLLRLTSLQQFQQQSHLSISDELLNFFLEESSTTGAGGDEQYRQRLRSEARRRVGWDPYNESPIKRRGEEYQHAGANGSTPDRYLSPADANNLALFSPSPRVRPLDLRSRTATPEVQPVLQDTSSSVSRRLNYTRGPHSVGRRDTSRSPGIRH